MEEGGKERWCRESWRFWPICHAVVPSINQLQCMFLFLWCRLLV